MPNLTHKDETDKFLDDIFWHGALIPDLHVVISVSTFGSFKVESFVSAL